MRDEEDQFNFKIKKRLKQDQWFAALPFKKKSLLAKYVGMHIQECFKRKP